MPGLLSAAAAALYSLGELGLSALQLHVLPRQLVIPALQRVDLNLLRRLALRLLMLRLPLWPGSEILVPRAQSIYLLVVLVRPGTGLAVARRG